MANLIKAYLTRDGLPKNKEFIPGDVLIFEKTIKKFFWDDEIIDKLYIFDLNRKVRFISEKKHMVGKFIIKEIDLRNYLGKHWDKYKLSYIYTLKIPLELI
jgi:hypothetical protein